MWTFLLIIATISLIIYWRGPNAIWGGILLGAIGGLLIAVVLLLMNKGFHLLIIGRGIVIGILLGLVVEIVGKLSKLIKKN